MEVHAKKISMSLPSALLDDLQYLSGRLGVSRSALMSEILGEAVPTLAELFRTVPEDASPDEARRLRGASVEIVRERLAEAQKLAEQLSAELAGCTCTITAHERQENRMCPVHFPRKARRGRA